MFANRKGEVDLVADATMGIQGIVNVVQGNRFCESSWLQAMFLDKTIVNEK